MDPPGRKAGYKSDHEDDDDLSENLLDECYEEEEDTKKINASLMERFGNENQKRTTAEWRVANNKPKQEKESDSEEEKHYQKKVKLNGNKKDDTDDDEENSNNDDDVDSTAPNFAEKMLGGKLACKACGKFPCKWFEYATEAHALFFEVGGTLVVLPHHLYAPLKLVTGSHSTRGCMVSVQT